jgi:NADH dehydrogenase [ubiquinone] 1 alpha subcomplex assembly factor 2
MPSRLYIFWKSLRLPWRKSFLAGSDLSGNTFWYLRNALHPGGRHRRILRPANKAIPHSDVAISPAWIQWLRYTRADPPTVDEQRADVERMERLKVLAAQADARWEGKESFLVAPRGEGSGEGRELGREAERAGLDDRGGEEVRRTVVRQEDLFRDDVSSRAEEDNTATSATMEKKVMRDEPADSPWKKAASKTMDEPIPWDPRAKRRK